jgi:hypothetical protein
MAQEREPSDRLTEEESGLDVHHGGQQEAAEEEGVEQGKPVSVKPISRCLPNAQQPTRGP